MAEAWGVEYNVAKEAPVIEALVSAIQPGDVVWDIGANLGFHACICAKVDKSVDVVAFEPHPTTAKRLRENIRLNDLTNVEALTIALSNQDANTVKFDPLDTETPGIVGPRLLTGASNTAYYGKELTVENNTGDSLVAERIVPSPDVVKLDVDGAEALVLDGLEETLRTHCREIFVEVHTGKHRNSVENYGGSASEIKTRLQQSGFAIEKLHTEETPSSELLVYHIQGCKQ